MLIKAQDLKDIQENKVTLVKNFASLTREYDFNLLSNLMEENECIISQKSNVGNLKDVFQIHKISNCLKEFKTFFDFLTKLFKYERDLRDEVDLFFSLVSQVGNSHVDIEDVFIIGLKGKVIYRVFDFEDKDYSIEQGDMIFIPKGIKHKVIGINPRIIASIGFYGKRIYNKK
jgi:cupin superfamily acireductone dioxygenase involved in methionine salvage|tara:strand:+ start:51 stop:569 length:519 start_codon:yes stop_codon:yes gene_type:complete